MTPLPTSRLNSPIPLDAVLEPTAAPGAAAGIERAGYGCAWVTETVRDPFLVLALAAGETRHIRLGTAVAIAFARSPMTLAQSAHDLQRISGGRLLLGLGWQIRPHITRRFGMPWSRPADRMREYVLAVRAIWAAWNDGAELGFQGEFYSHTLMTPVFDPGPNGFGPPPVLLGGVGARMTEVAGEVADGFLCGPLTSVASFRGYTLPALEKGRVRSAVEVFSVSGMPFVVTGADTEATASVAAATRARIAFYASTPAYRFVLEAHGSGCTTGCTRSRGSVAGRRWPISSTTRYSTRSRSSPNRTRWRRCCTSGGAVWSTGSPCTVPTTPETRSGP